MVRPAGRPLARRAVTLEDLREESLAHCEARNLSGRTLEWYSDRTRRFTDWCSVKGISVPSDPRWSDLEEFVLDAVAVGSLPTLCTATPRSSRLSAGSAIRWATSRGISPRISRCPGFPRPSSPPSPTSSSRLSWQP
jgi:hypothetical protein